MSTEQPTTPLDEEVLRSFIWSVWNFFSISTEQEPEVGTPYLFDSFKHDDYTGVIGVSGTQKGAIYFTIDTPFLETVMFKHYGRHLPKDMTPEELDHYRSDYVGEVVNIISGNVRNYLGHDFLISVPIVITAPGTPLHIASEGCGIVFPILWSSQKCHLILNLQATTTASAAAPSFHLS